MGRGEYECREGVGRGEYECGEGVKWEGRV